MTALSVESQDQALRSSETSGDKETPVNKTAMYVSAGVVCFVVLCLTVLSYSNKDTRDFFLIVGSVVTPLLLALGAAKLQELKTQNEHIKQQTNGNTSQMMDMLREALLDKRSQQPPDKPDSA